MATPKNASNPTSPGSPAQAPPPDGPPAAMGSPRPTTNTPSSGRANAGESTRGSPTSFGAPAPIGLYAGFGGSPFAAKGWYKQLTAGDLLAAPLAATAPRSTNAVVRASATAAALREPLKSAERDRHRASKSRTPIATRDAKRAADQRNPPGVAHWHARAAPAPDLRPLGPPAAPIPAMRAASSSAMSHRSSVDKTSRAASTAAAADDREAVVVATERQRRPRSSAPAACRSSHLPSAVLSRLPDEKRRRRALASGAKQQQQQQQPRDATSSRAAAAHRPSHGDRSTPAGAHHYHRSSAHGMMDNHHHGEEGGGRQDDPFALSGCGSVEIAGVAWSAARQQEAFAASATQERSPVANLLQRSTSRHGHSQMHTAEWLEQLRAASPDEPDPLIIEALGGPFSPQPSGGPWHAAMGVALLAPPGPAPAGRRTPVPQQRGDSLQQQQQAQHNSAARRNSRQRREEQQRRRRQQSPWTTAPAVGGSMRSLQPFEIQRSPGAVGAGDSGNNHQPPLPQFRTLSPTPQFGLPSAHDPNALLTPPSVAAGSSRPRTPQPALNTLAPSSATAPTPQPSDRGVQSPPPATAGAGRSAKGATAPKPRGHQSGQQQQQQQQQQRGSAPATGAHRQHSAASPVGATTPDSRKVIAAVMRRAEITFDVLVGVAQYLNVDAWLAMRCVCTRWAAAVQQCLLHYVGASASVCSGDEWIWRHTGERGQRARVTALAAVTTAHRLEQVHLKGGEHAKVLMPPSLTRPQKASSAFTRLRGLTVSANHEWDAPMVPLDFVSLLLRRVNACIALRYLDVSGTRGRVTDRSMIDLASRCPDLLHLNVSDTGKKITDGGIRFLAEHCPGLTHLNVSFTDGAITDEALEAVADHCQSLTHLDVRSTAGAITTRGIAAIVDSCPGLTHLDVGYTCGAIDDRAILRAATRCRGLQHVGIARTEHAVTATGLATLGRHCPGLTSLDITGNDGAISHIVLVDIAQRCQLVRLAVGDCAGAFAALTTAVERVNFATVAQHLGPSLTALNCRGLGRVVDDEAVLAVAQRCPHLTHIDLSFTQGAVTDVAFTELVTSCRELRHVDIRATEGAITNVSIFQLARTCPSLTHLNVQGTKGKITDAALKEVAAACRGLRHLTVRDTRGRVTDATLFALAKHCPSLTALDASSTRGGVTDVGVRALLKGCRHLALLDVTFTRGAITRQCALEIEEEHPGLVLLRQGGAGEHPPGE